MSTSDHYLLQQGGAEWLEARIGKITASRIADVIAVTKNGPSEKRTSYLKQLVAERLTGRATSVYTNDAMLWGQEQEANARDLYAEKYGVEVVEVGLLLHRDMDFAGASPDGLVGFDGLVEIKCLTTVNHLSYIHDNEPPKQYLPQVHWQMAVVNSDWCDLCLYDPRVPEEMQMKVFRIERDEAEIKRLEEAVITFNNEIEQYISTIWSNTK